MPSFCSPEDKPTIYYKFKGDTAYRKIQIGIAPIEIIIEPIQEFNSTIRTFRSSNDAEFSIAAKSARKKLVFKLFRTKGNIYDAFGQWTNQRTKNSGEVNPYNYKARAYQETIFEGLLAQDGYSLFIYSMFGEAYPLEFEYQEYF